MRKSSWLYDYLKGVGIKIISCGNVNKKGNNVYRGDCSVDLFGDKDGTGALSMLLNCKCTSHGVYDIPFKDIIFRGNDLDVDCLIEASGLKDIKVPDNEVWFSLWRSLKSAGYYYTDIEFHINVEFAVVEAPDGMVAYPIGVVVVTSLDMYGSAEGYRAPVISNICNLVNSPDFIEFINAKGIPESIEIKPRLGQVNIVFSNYNVFHVDLGLEHEWNKGYRPDILLSSLSAMLGKVIRKDLGNPLMYNKLDYNHLSGNLLNMEY